MKLIVDVDATLNNLGQVWLGRYNQDYNDNLTDNDILNWDTHKFVKPECGRKIYDYLKDPSVYTQCVPQPHSMAALEALSTSHEIIIASASVPTAVEPKSAWLRKYYPFINKKNFIFTERKDLLTGDWLIDDGFHNVVSFQGRAILLAYKHNEADWNTYNTGFNTIIRNIIRLRDWQEIYQLLKV